MKCAISVLGIILFILCLFGFGLQRADAATTWYVDDDAPNDPGPGDTDVSDPAENGTQDHPFDSIQEAVNSTWDGDGIIVRDGLYTGDGNRDIIFRGKGIHLRSENGPDNCVIDCQGTYDETHRGFVFDGEGDLSILEGFTITGGFSPKGAGVGETSGGGIYCKGAAPTFRNNVFWGNAAVYIGSAICLDNSAAVITDNVFTANSSDAAVACYDSVSPTVTNNLITGNTAAGVRFQDCSDIVCSGNTVTESADHGIHVWDASGVVSDNTVVANEGSGISSSQCEGSSSIIITRNLLVDNNVGVTDSNSSSPVEVFDCLIAGNNRGIGCWYTSSMTVTNCTIVANRSTGVSGINCWRTPSLTLVNCILWANYYIREPARVSQVNISESTITISYSNLENGKLAVNPGHLAAVNWGSGNISADPMFVEPGHWSDPNGTIHDPWDDVFVMGDYRLQPGSPCVDIGQPGAARSGHTDLDGAPRVVGGRIDIGAYEQRPALYVDDAPPADFNTIQAAIEAAFDGGTIIVRDGTYTGAGNRDIDFKGKAVHLKSENGPDNCIIDAQGSEAEPHRGFVFQNGEGADSILDGFTIRGGYADSGGGIACEGASPSIINNTITNNTADGGGNGDGGGGIYSSGDSSPEIIDNTIIGNSARHGAGVSCNGSSPTITGNMIAGNTAVSLGGGIRCIDSSTIITGNIICDNEANNGGAVSYGSSSGAFRNNTIAGNTGWNRGGAIDCGDSSSVTVENSILWNNTSPRGPEIALTAPPVSLTVLHSDVAGGAQAASVPDGCILSWGSGNINADPRFADPGNGDYHLKSEYGRWDPSANAGAGGWVLDGVTSPCIDAGDPTSDFAAEPQGNGRRINIGAYGNTAQASKTDAGPGPILYVDDDAPFDPAPGVPLGSDPLEDGSADHPFDAIAEAVSAAQNGDVVMLRDGTYTGQGNRDVDFNGKRITIRSENGPESCIIDCNGSDSGPHNGFYLHSGQGPETIIDGLTITGSGGYGGAIWCFEASPTIRNNVLRDNSGVAGGVFCRYSAAIIENNTFLQNELLVSSSYGAGITAVLSSLTITGNLFSENHAGTGAAVSCTAGSCLIQDNIMVDASDGGAVYCTQGSTATITDNIIIGNTDTAIHADESSALVSNNVIQGNGAGLFLQNGDTTTILNNFIIDNGVGIGIQESSPEVIGNVIAGNRTTDDGGAISCRGMWGNFSPVFTNNTIAFNRAQVTGGAVRFVGYGGGVFTNCIFWGNRAREADQIRLEANEFGNVATFKNCIIEGGQTQIIADEGCTVLWKTGNIDEDPLFADEGTLDDGGTPWLVGDDVFVPGEYHLFPSSPCIDAGTNDVALPPTDVIGNPRKVNGDGDLSHVVDIGAYEFLPGDANSAAGLVLTGPDERDEGPLPDGDGTVTIDVHAEGLADIRSVQVSLNIDGPWNSGPNSFSISTTYANPLFGDHAITHNTVLLPNITPIFDAATQTVGFSLPEGTLNATSRKWLFSITYDYSLSVPGRYSIDTDSERSEIHLAGGPTPFYVAPAEMFIAALEADLFVDDDAPADPGPGDTSVSDPAEDGSAEHPFDAIQEAIDAAQDGQVIVVRDGLYTGAGNRGIYFRGKAITVRSQNGPEDCIVDAQATSYDRNAVFMLFNGEGPDSVLEGLTIMGAYTSSDVRWAGIVCSNSSPTIRNNIILDNYCYEGGGIRCSGGSPMIVGNTIVSNPSGGGITAADNSTPTIVNNIVSSNSGGGIEVTGGLIANNVITNNQGDHYYSPAVRCLGTVTVANNVIVDNPTRGIMSVGDSVQITGNLIENNSRGGIGSTGPSATITFNIIRNNDERGGIYNTSSAVIAYNIITGNTYDSGGGLLVLRCTDVTIINCTIAGNTAADYAGRLEKGGGLYAFEADVTVSNCIFRDNVAADGPQIAVKDPVGVAVSYCNVAGGLEAVYGNEDPEFTWGPGNIDVDPLLADPDNGDYHLKSEDGRWDPDANSGAGAWVLDSVTSPCIDAGDPASDFANEPEPDGGRINMGAYGNTAQASKFYVPPLTSDLTVLSTPITGANITGDKPGSTNYTATCNFGETIAITAPQTATTPQGVRYNFVRWSDYPDGQATIELTMDADRTATAVYEIRTHTLTVQSVPITRVQITGDRPGRTNYTATCGDQEVVNLTAPATVITAGDRHDFVRWIVDGQDQPDGQATIQITADADVTATAVYAMLMGNMYIEGPNERGEGPMPPATGFTPDTIGLFLVDVYAENMPRFAGFLATLQFLDDTLADATDSSIFLAYNNIPPDQNAPWDDRIVTWNQAFLPQITDLISGNAFGLESTEMQAGECVDKTITNKTWLMTVGYWYMPGAEGSGTQTYTIGASSATFYAAAAQPIPNSVFAGSVTIGGPVTHYVDDDAPADFDTIQAAIDASSDGDTIIVRDGTYTGDGNRDIDFGGKAVHLRSENGPDNCIIDAQGSEAESHRGFYFNNGEDESSILDGFTITGGYASSGGGMHCYESSPTITNSTIAANTASFGGGIFSNNSSPIITNNTITANTADSYGGGIYCQDNSSPTVDNTILWGNSASQGSEIGLYSPSILTARYCDVAGGAGAAYVEDGATLTWGPGNFDADPLFADPDNGDYHLKSEHGRWNPNANGGAGDWVLDTVTSLCVNGGDPASDFSNEPMFNGERINVGAYGNTPEASKNRWLITTDANFDDKIDILDLLTVRDKLQEDPTSDNNWRCDVNTDGFINILDLIYVRNHLGTRRE